MTMARGFPFTVITYSSLPTPSQKRAGFDLISRLVINFIEVSFYDILYVLHIIEKCLYLGQSRDLFLSNLYPTHNPSHKI
jgi:hypothetical protein